MELSPSRKNTESGAKTRLKLVEGLEAKTGPLRVVVVGRLDIGVRVACERGLRSHSLAVLSARVRSMPLRTSEPQADGTRVGLMSGEPFTQLGAPAPEMGTRC